MNMVHSPVRAAATNTGLPMLNCNAGKAYAPFPSPALSLSAYSQLSMSTLHEDSKSVDSIWNTVLRRCTVNGQRMSSMADSPAIHAFGICVGVSLADK
jgi:hypothetical protein